MVYDITKRKTFETLQQWVSELRTQGPENIILAIAGNKSDLESERQVGVLLYSDGLCLDPISPFPSPLLLSPTFTPQHANPSFP